MLLAERSEHRVAVARFLAEARAASAIRHRNIIEILDSAQLPDGRHYILMEHLEGETLRKLQQRVGRMSPASTLAILAQVCSGLAAAHARGIVHRDLEPSNIFVSPQPDNPLFTKVLDFGVTTVCALDVVVVVVVDVNVKRGHRRGLGDVDSTRPEACVGASVKVNVHGGVHVHVHVHVNVNVYELVQARILTGTIPGVVRSHAKVMR